MPTTSSPISSRPSPASPDRRVGPLTGWTVLAAVQIALAFGLRGSGDTVQNALFDWTVAINGLVVYAVLVGLTFWIGSGFERTPEALGLKPFERRWLGWAGGAVVLALALGGILEPLLHAGKEQGLEPTRWVSGHTGAFVVNAFVIVLAAPFAEELFFRGLGVRAVAFLGALPAVAVTALVFGLAHGILVALPQLVVFGAALAWVRLRADSVWPGVTAHATYNAIGIALALAAIASK